MEIKNTRWYETILVAAAFVVYVVQRLFEEQAHFNEVLRSATREGAFDEMVLGSLPGYEYKYYVTIPIICSALVLLSAWMIFHSLLIPNIKNPQRNTNRTLLYGSLFIAFVFVSLLIYYTSFQPIKSLQLFTEDSDSSSITTYFSVFRKKHILGDAIGIGFLFAFYELITNALKKIHAYFSKENLEIFTWLTSILPLLPAASLFIVAFFTHIPTPLWSGNTQSFLWWISSVTVIWTMQEYIMLFLITNYKKRISIFLPYLFVFTVSFLIANLLIWAANSNFYFYRNVTAIISRSFFKQIIRTLGPILIIVAFRKVILKEKIGLEQQVAGTSAELAQLRSQINPHFLFNALNSLYAAALKESAEKTADGIQRLGDMMRFILQENNLERISVEKEIEYLHNYIHLQRIRIDETQGIEIKVVLNQLDNDMYIAPMLLIPFVENAFKHGISHRSKSWIIITLSFDATHLYFRVQNSRHIRHESDPEEYQSGIGLQNVQKRLQLLYPGRHTLQLQESNHDYHIFLTLSI